MKVSCLQENLSRALELVNHVIDTRGIWPQCVLMATDGDRLKMIATNLEMTITCWIGAKIEEEGSIAVKAKLLSDFVSSLPAERIDLSVSKTRKLGLSVKCSRQEADISGMSIKDFLPIPNIKDGVTVKVEAEALRNAIAKIAFVAATDLSRPVLTGVSAKFEGNLLTFAATDSFRLAVYKLPTSEPVSQNMDIIIPARTLSELNRLGITQDDPIEITVNASKSQVCFRLKNTELVSQLIQGSYPNYTPLIPQKYSTRAVTNVSDLLRAVKIASSFSRDTGGIVRLEIIASKVIVSTRSEDTGDSIAELDASMEGQDTKIAFNGKYLAEVLSTLNNQQISIEMNGSSNPAVFRSVGDDNYIHAIMPIFVQW